MHLGIGIRHWGKISQAICKNIIALLISHRFVHGKFSVMFFCHQKCKSYIEYRCPKRCDHINQWHANTFCYMGRFSTYNGVGIKICRYVSNAQNRSY